MTPDWQTMEAPPHFPAAAQQLQQLLPQLQSSSSSSSSDWVKSRLSEECALAIEDLRVCYRNSLDVNVETVNSLKEQKNLTDLVNIAELSVRRVIAMVKQVDTDSLHQFGHLY